MERKFDVIINVLGVICPINEAGERGDAERSESSSAGVLTERDGGVVLGFREKSEGGELYSEISVTPDCVTVKRRGAIISDMVFREGKSTKSLYKIPPYSFDMEISCRRMKISLGEREGRADLLYTMNVGGEARSARMKITWKQENKSSKNA